MNRHVGPERVGDRVRLIWVNDTWTRIPKGTEGTVRFIDDFGTIHVRWDDGSALGLIPGEDRWEHLADVSA